MTKPAQDRSLALAIFDLDRTITRRGTWTRFVWQNLKHKPWLWIPATVSTVWAQLRYTMGTLERTEVKRTMMRWSMTGQDRAVLEQRGRDFAAREVNGGLRPGAVDCLRAHQQSGDPVVIITAAVDIVAEPIGELLGVNYVVATQMAWDDQGKLLSDFASPNCYGPEKVTRFKALKDSHPDLIKNRASIMYSDSEADIPLMTYCDKGVAVNPKAKMRNLAPEYGFEIVDWNNSLS